jgi:hypothetical protein
VSNQSWIYPIQGEHARFPDTQVESAVEARYFSKGGKGYSLSGVLRSMALFIDQLDQTDSVEAISVYPEFRNGDDADRWAGIVTVYRDKLASNMGTPTVS